MMLSFLNPAFKMLNFCTIGCISVGIAYLVGAELGKANGRDSVFCGVLAVFALISVSDTSMSITANDGSVITTVSGIFSSSLGSGGLFTGMFIAILSAELYHAICKIDALQIKMPDQVPANVAKSFSALIPGFLVLLVTSLLSLFVVTVTGSSINDLVFMCIQKPLQHIGGSLPGFMTFELIALLFWSVGLHGDNITSGVLKPILTGLIVENLDAVAAGGAPVNIVNECFQRGFYGLGGTGMMLSLTIGF
jgi:PTS system cellobiose-specific IIC component